MLVECRSKRRPLFDARHPQFDAELRFIRWPYYRVMEVCEITGLKDDKVRDAFRSGQYGEVVEVVSEKHDPRKRAWRSLLIPLAALRRLLGR